MSEVWSMSCPREEREALERLLVGPYGVLAAQTRGRLTPEPECEIRTCFQRDIDRITHSKSFRRLKHKTQVFLQPEGDHYRTRLTHTLEVTRLARTVARALRLNEDLAEAMALGHDLGHTPFGHAGERALNGICRGGFKHYEQSLRVVDILERDGQGLNLCYETRMGILHHTYGSPDDTREATVVRLCDRIAYINHDLDDSIRAGLLTAEAVPALIRENCGERNSERINAFITDLVKNSVESSEADSTEAINREVRLLLSDRNIFYRRFADAYPEVIYRTERISARMEAIRVETEQLRREAEQRLASGKDQLAQRLEPTGAIKSTVIEKQGALIDLLYDDASATDEMRGLKKAIDTDLERLQGRRLI